MIKNITIIILFVAFVAMVILHTKAHYSATRNEYGHPIPKEQSIYAARDPENEATAFIIYATEWTDKNWQLTVLFKNEKNEVMRFWTAPPNDPRQWIADKLKSPESAKSEPMPIEQVENPVGFESPVWGKR